MTVLHIHLLGGLNVTGDQEPLSPISGAVVRSLFAYLLTYRDQPHTRDLLAGTFWPELPDTAARRRLSQALWRVRRALQREHPCPPVLLAEGDTVQLNPDLPLWLDVQEFERQIAGGTLPELGAATELYHGDFLAGYYDDWLLMERARLRDLFLATLERLCNGYKGRGQYEQALVYARRLASEAPWREEAHREVMRLCHLLGRDNEALKQFDVCRQALAEELAAKPSPETVALAREIATRDLADRSEPSLVLDLPEAPPPPAAIILDSDEALELPLVGREQQRAELLAQIDALFQGLGGIVLLEGEAGIGKTRLLQTMARDAKWRGAEVLWGAAQEIEPALPYGPLAAALAGGLSSLRASQLSQVVDSIWLQVLAALLPSLTTWLPDLLPPPQLDPAQERDRLVAALARLLAGWGQIKPLLVVLENLHWAGEDALDMLARLAPALSDCGVLLVGSYRGEEARALPGIWQKLQALDRAGVRHRLILGGLDAEATGELVRRCLGLGDAVPFFERRLYEETKGNPLFVLETLRALYGEGLLAQDAAGQWSTPWDETTDDYAELPLPRAVEQTIARRLAFLSPALQQMVYLAAVLGERFNFDLFHAASHEESPRLLAALRELVQRRFLDETATDYRFSHDKIRQVAYEGIEAGQRSSLHRQAAGALEALQPERVAALAHHWTRAEGWDKAAGYHQQAGDRARAVYANAEAAAHYTEALAALEHLPGPDTLPLRFQLLLAREAVYDLLNQREVQAEDLAALAALVEELDDEAQAAQVALRRGMYADKSGDFPAAIEAAQLAIRLARAARDGQLEAKGQRQSGRALIRQGAYQEARSRLQAALDLARRHCLPAVEAASLIDLGTISRRQGDYERASMRCEQALRLLRQIGDRQSEAKVLNNLGLGARCQEDYAGARAYHQQSLHIRREIGDQRGESAVLNNLGIIYRHQGDYASAKMYFEQALAIMHSSGDRWSEGLVTNNLGLCSINLGDYSSAGTYFEHLLQVSREIGDRSTEVMSLEGQGRVCHHQGDNHTAQERLLTATRIVEKLGDRDSEAYILTSLGDVLIELGQIEKAAKTYQRAVDLRRDLGQSQKAMEPLTGVAHACLKQGDLVRARGHVDEILAQLKTSPPTGVEQPFKIYLICHQVLRAVQDPRAGTVLTTAHDLLQERAAKIEDEELRRSYLENVATHREIVAAYHERQGHRIAARLPRADAPTGRPLRDDEYVTVTWTVEAPGDKEIRRKPDRRRHRIQRLLAEAQAQGAIPRDRDLAQALGVSLPTLRRDMAALRAAGHDLPTRGRK